MIWYCDGKGAIWFGLVLWTKLATNGEKLLKRLKLLREKDQSLWALSEYEERIWKLPTLARLESIWNQWTVASTHIFKVSIPQILSQKFPSKSPFTFNQQVFGFNSKNIFCKFSIIHRLYLYSTVLRIFFLCFFIRIFLRNIFSFVFTLSLQSWSSRMSGQNLRDLFLQHQPFHTFDTKSFELKWTSIFQKNQ